MGELLLTLLELLRTDRLGLLIRLLSLLCLRRLCLRRLRLRHLCLRRLRLRLLGCPIAVRRTATDCLAFLSSLATNSSAVDVGLAPDDLHVGGSADRLLACLLLILLILLILPVLPVLLIPQLVAYQLLLAY